MAAATVSAAIPDTAANWSPELKEEFARSQFNPQVGSRLVSESERVRVWHIALRPGERLPFHRHVLDYFWTAVTPGKALSHLQDGTTVEVEYQVGDTRHHRYGAGEFKIHDLENTGDTELVFTTVEFLDSTNAPLLLPSSAAGARTPRHG